MWNAGGHDSNWGWALGTALGTRDALERQDREIANLRRLRQLDALRAEARSLVAVIAAKRARREADARERHDAAMKDAVARVRHDTAMRAAVAAVTRRRDGE
jgi:predicted transcriptional regulator